MGLYNSIALKLLAVKEFGSAPGLMDIEIFDRKPLD